MKPGFKAIALSVSMLTTALTTIAQNAPGVGGQITQNGNRPVEFATVTLLKAKDSSLVKGAIADINGKYEFEQVKQGQYLVAAVSVGMNKAYSSAFEVGNGRVSVPAVTLQAVSKALKGVDVTARRPFVEQKADKMVVNVENSITASGGSAMEVLEKSPTITVDKDGNISMKGKAGVVIMIDGKPTNMTSQDVAELLKSMPAANLDQIELIANPSARYDAAGNAGIINIKLKKNANYGTNGSVNLGGIQGERPRYNGGLNLNHRTAKMNIFGSYNYSHRENQQELTVYRSYMEDGQQKVYDQANNMTQKSNYQGGKIGADYFLSKGHTIGVMIDLSSNHRFFPTYANTLIGNGQRVDSILSTNTNYDGKWKRGAYNINYRGVLDSTGRELNVDLDYARNTNRQLTDLYAFSRGTNEKLLLGSDTSRSNQPSTIDIKTAKIDYIQPLKHQAKLEVGAKVSFVTSDNNARFDSLRMGNWMLDENRTNHFIYKENINAAYINYNRQFKKIGVQLGLRGEQTHISGSSASQKAQQPVLVKNDSTYFNLFPSMALTYNMNKNNTFGLTYSRRIQRPSYDDLNPFEFYLDRYTKQAGNPYLKPQYSNNFEITHTFKQFLITSIGYSHTKDMMTRLLESDVDKSTGDSSILRYKYMNVAKSDNFNLNVSMPMPVTKWWTSFTTLSVSYSNFQTVVNNNNVKTASAAFFGRTQHTFTITKKIAAEATFFYVSPQVTEEGLFKMKAMSSLDLGASMKVLNNKGSVKLNVSDIFRTSYFRGDFSNAGRYTAVANRWDSRQVRLSFNYRFGNTNVKAARTRQTGLEAEQSRVKGGN
ncbi:outer membrane receptor protein involved in Fe transport [Chitinophaga polysaccharea]|uniref:Outer membrane receptor protein involved in Fe transport n=1 Tax=Chitinophaga polysaccharea TaxID=1293035 RepID=A0A561P324_9BACT|nr:outer membrane beta-barrel family protein [Chitinophaga polysaccharea]TWF32520.1 outer membrane receptor protein involved in Fe transport [Chitinophaga polysaccharea]